MEEVLDVFGQVDHRWFLVKYVGHRVPEWSRGHLRLTDGCEESIRDFWSKSGKSPNQNFYLDPQRRHRCAVCGCSYKRAQDLKSHITRKGHQNEKQNRITATAYADALAIKKKQHQDSLPRVRWGEKETDNV